MTYSKFKLTIKIEPYHDIISSANLRKLLSKFRLSSHDLEIETGRYGNKSIPPEQRICKICDLSLVEDEVHFLMVFSKFSNLRTSLFQDVDNINPNFSASMDADKFVWLMSQEDKQITLKFANFLKNATRIRNYELETQNLSKKNKESKKF